MLILNNISPRSVRIGRLPIRILRSLSGNRLPQRFLRLLLRKVRKQVRIQNCGSPGCSPIQTSIRFPSRLYNPSMPESGVAVHWIFFNTAVIMCLKQH